MIAVQCSVQISLARSGTHLHCPIPCHLQESIVITAVGVAQGRERETVETGGRDLRQRQNRRCQIVGRLRVGPEVKVDLPLPALPGFHPDLYPAEPGVASDEGLPHRV